MMTRILAAWFFAMTGFRAIPAERLLLLIDHSLVLPLGREIQAWKRQVEVEGRYRVTVRLVRRATTEAARLNELRTMRRLIDYYQPAAVQMIGGLAWGISGWGSPDGHEERAMVTDAHLMAARAEWTDARFWGATGSRPNEPHDGRWDQSAFVSWGRPVARIDLAGMDEGLQGPGYEFPSGCAEGMPICPPLKEIDALRDYFARNLQFRAGRPPAKTAAISGALWSQYGYDVWAADAMPQFAWSADDAAGLDVFLLWTDASAQEIGRHHGGPGCEMTRAVWVNTFRSFGMEPTGSCSTLRRWLTRALVSTWGGKWWVIPPGADTVADAITQTRAIQGRWYMWHTVLGDLTLPVGQPLVEPP